MIGRRLRSRSRVRRTRRAMMLRLLPLAVVSTMVAALLAVVAVSRLSVDDQTNEPAAVDKHEFTITPGPERVAYTPEDAAEVVTDDPVVPTIQSGVVVAELEPHDLPGFELLGVTWTGGVPVDVTEVQVRWRQEGQWSDWTILEPQSETPEGTTPGTDPKWVGPSEAAQARVVASTDIDPEGLTLVTVDPGQTPTLTQAASAVGQPNIIMRSSWGARAYGGSGCGTAPSNGTFSGTIVHHTAGSNNYTAAQSAGIVKSIQSYHMSGQGWCDIGYNFLIDRYGQIFEGRAGGITNTPYGAHAGNTQVNQNTTGVSLMGEFTSEVPPAAMKDSLVKLIAWRHSLFGVPAKGTYSIGGVTIQRIDGHRSVKSTACPGNQVFNWMNSQGGLRDQVAAAMVSFDVYGAIGAYWQAQGGSSGAIGAPTSEQVGVGQGAVQRFANMDLWWTAERGVIPVRGTIRTEYRTVGETKSGLGWPTGPEVSVAGGAYQDFTGGRIYAYPATGTFAIADQMYTTHEARGNINGVLGWPTSRASRVGNGSVQRFQKGSIYSPDNRKTFVLDGAIEDRYEALGGASGSMGWPTSELTSNTSVTFERGFIYSSGGQVTSVAGVIGRTYLANGGATGTLGLPTSAERAVGNGYVQDFVGGQIQCWPGATIVVPKTFVAAHQSAGGPTGVLGWPTTSAAQITAGGYRQDYQSGRIYATSTTTGNAYVLRGTLLKLFGQYGGEAKLGRPTSNESTGGGVIGQTFASAGLYLPTDGRPGFIVDGSIWTAYAAAGGSSNANLGYPTGASTKVGTATRQVFSASTFYVRGSSTHIVRGYLRTLYTSLGGDTGRLGLPTESEISVSGGAAQHFDKGVLWVSTAGAQATYGAIATEYERRGGPGGQLGWPVGSQVTEGSATTQKFQNGTLVMNANGTFTVR